jgi:hypothetical protein
MELSEDYRKLISDVETENKDEIAQAEKLAKGPWYRRATSVAGSVATGAGKGVANAGVDVFNTLTDLGFYAGAGIDQEISQIMGKDEKQTDERIKEKFQKVSASRDRIVNYVKQNETDDQVANFTMHATESLLQFGTIYKALGKAAMKQSTKAVVAGAGEGFMDDVKNDMLVLDKTLRLAIEQVAPEAVADFDKMTNINVESDVADQLNKRVLSAIEMGLFGAAGEAAAPVVTGAVKEMARHIPESMKRKAVDGFGQVMTKMRKMREYVTKPELAKNKTLDAYIMQPGESKFEIVKGSFSPDKTAKENLRQGILSKFDESAKILDEQSYSTRLQEYEKKLADLAPEIEQEVVNMAETKGLSSKEALATFAKELGVEETEKMTVEGLKNVLRGQAHNIMLEQESSAFALAIGNKNKGIISQEQYIESAKSLHTVIKQRMSLLTGAGRALRGAQEIPQALQAIQKEIVNSGRSLNDIMEVYGKTIDDPAALEALSQQMEGAFALHGVVGDGPDEIMKSMAKALAKADKAKSNKDRASDLGRAFSSIYQANLLSGTTTLAQNTFGSAAQMMLQATDTFGEATMAKIRGRQAGDATFREAYIQLSNIVSGHWDAIRVSATAAKNMRKNGFASAGQTIRNEFSNIPQMSTREREFTLQLSKEDMSQTAPSIEKNISSNFFESINKDAAIMDRTAETAYGAATLLAEKGQKLVSPVFGVIKTQDTITKSISAQAYMRGRFHTAVYVDDVLGIKEGVTKPEQAKKILKEMFERGDDVIPVADLKAMGIDEKKAIDISQRLSLWRNQTSEDATKYALSAAMQTPLKGNMKKLQTLLQDSIPFGRILVPFFTTPVNIVNEALQRMPILQLGEASAIGLPVHPKFYTDFAAGGQKRNQALARLTSGMAIAQAGQSLAESGIIQYTPSNPEEQIAVDSMFNITSGSINLGGESIPLAFMGPAGILLNYGAALNYHRGFENRLLLMPDEEVNKFNDATLFNLMSVMEIVREAPYAQAFDDIASGLFGTDFEDKKQIDRFKDYLARTAGNAVPYSGLQRQLANNLMEEKTRANGLWQSFKSSFSPYANMEARNAFGETMGNTKGVVLRHKEIKDDMTVSKLIDGAAFYPTPMKIDQLVQSRPSEPYVSVRLTPEQYTQLNDIIRDELKIREQFDKFTSSKKFIENVELDDIGIERNNIDANSIMSKTRKQALDRLIYRNPDILSDVTRKAGEQRARQSAARQVPAGATIPTFSIGN